MKDFEIYGTGLVYTSVCAVASMPAEEVARRLNEENPSGVMHPWTLAEENFRGGNPNPCPCDLSPETHRHYLFNC